MAALRIEADVDAEQYYYNDILALQQQGIIHGFPDGTFKPDLPVTRGQAAKMLAGILQLNTTNVANPNFNDITSSNPYYGAIAALRAAGIIDGFEDNSFREQLPIQRQHMAKMIAEALQLEASNPEEMPFTDVEELYAPYIAALYEYEITRGTTATTFDGPAEVTRGQMASFLVRAINAQIPPELPVGTYTLTIDELTANTVVSNNQTYTLSAETKQILTMQNK